MLLCSDDVSGTVVVHVVHPPSTACAPLPPSSRGTPADSVFTRLHRSHVSSLSSAAFDAVVARARREAAACTFAPCITHTHDDALRQWSGGVDVFHRLYGHAQCRREDQVTLSEMRAAADEAEAQTLCQRYRSYTFPSHLHPTTAASATPHRPPPRRSAVSLASCIAAPSPPLVETVPVAALRRDAPGLPTSSAAEKADRQLVRMRAARKATAPGS